MLDGRHPRLLGSLTLSWESVNPLLLTASRGVCVPSRNKGRSKHKQNDTRRRSGRASPEGAAETAQAPAGRRPSLESSREGGVLPSTPNRPGSPTGDSSAGTRENRIRSWALNAAGTAAVILVTAAVSYVLAAKQGAREQQGAIDAQRVTAEGKPALSASVDFAYGDQDGDIWVAPNKVFSGERELAGDVHQKVVSAGGFELGTPPPEHPKGQTATRLRVTIVGQRYNGVVVKDIKVRVLRRAAPLHGSLLLGPPQGAETVSEVGFDLDSTDVTAREIEPDGQLGTGYWRGHQFIKLAQHEPQVIEVTALTARDFCEWVLEFEVADTDQVTKSEVVEVRNNDGTPFRSTPVAGGYDERYDFDFRAAKWRLADSGQVTDW
ncbi:hypothetical protein ABT369_40440 [Dactylosporangium sp. NPDC000244]|uniref:hypothetical protein n=1 Tax=Dactylosporangium sp. NPDC000244 TaxID=3154365 RepID=UPI0033233AF0